MAFNVGDKVTINRAAWWVGVWEIVGVDVADHFYVKHVQEGDPSGWPGNVSNLAPLNHVARCDAASMERID